MLFVLPIPPPNSKPLIQSDNKIVMRFNCLNNNQLAEFQLIFHMYDYRYSPATVVRILHTMVNTDMSHITWKKVS